MIKIIKPDATSASGSEDVLTKSTKETLVQEMQQQETENYKAEEINWMDGDFWDSWDKVNGHMKKNWGHGKEYIGEPPKWFFLAHDKDVVQGKPLLIQNTKVRLPLVKLIIKKQKDKDAEEGTIDTQNFYMLGEPFDKRSKGYILESFALDFYKYKVETPEDKEVYVFSQTKLSNENSLLKGMLIELDDYSEMSKTMKIPSLSRLFFVKDSEPAIKTLPKEELVKLIKSNKINEEGWLRHLVTHPFKTINNFPMESEMLHSAQMLCGKFDGYPLHICYMGPQGTRKTMGKGETTEFKFGAEKIMIDAGNVRLKGLIPSYKGTITKPGYLSEQNRIAIVDELGKMIEAETMKHDKIVDNALGELNSILEHKERLAVSGNTSTSNMKPSAKNIFISNPVGTRKTIGHHVGLIDPTTMSRIVWWVQDKQEQSFVLGLDGIHRKSPLDYSNTQSQREPNPPKTMNIECNWLSVIENRKTDIPLTQSKGEYLSRDIFLTIFDSCYSFVSEVDYAQVQKLVDITTNLSKEPMRGVWGPRAFHHIFLIVDGLCKHRCLFRDYDDTFKVKEEDYNLAELILIRMVSGWDTNLQPKEDL